MIRLEAITQDNWTEAARLSVSKEQQDYLDTPTGILARGYVYRDCNARVLAIVNGSTVVGIALVRDLDQAPACYDLQQFLIDRRHQHLGYGTQALQLILAMLRKERKYGRVDVCVHQADAPALRLFRKAGFADTGYFDDQAPDCINLTYRFTDHQE